jgi:hypothetical protein
MTSIQAKKMQNPHCCLRCQQTVFRPALNMAEVVPTADPVKRRLELDAAAEMVRSSYTSARNEEERFIVADKALAVMTSC